MCTYSQLNNKYKNLCVTPSWGQWHPLCPKIVTRLAGQISQNVLKMKARNILH